MEDEVNSNGVGLLGMLAMPTWVKKQNMMLEKEWTARIQELQREGTRLERELRLLQLQPKGTARFIAPPFEFSDQPTRSMKALCGYDIHLFIRGSK